MGHSIPDGKRKCNAQAQECLGERGAAMASKTSSDANPAATIILIVIVIIISYTNIYIYIY